jgi:hypothetical protein
VALIAAAVALLQTDHVLAEPAPFAPQKVLPVDQATQDKSFLEFRRNLQEAIQRRDTKFLLGAVDPEIKLSFAEDYGLKRFREMWQPERPESKIWEQLDDVLRLGGTFGYDQDSSHTFWAPYVFGRFKSGDALDVFEALVVIGEEVKLRSSPSTEAPVVAMLSHEVVHQVTDEPKAGENVRWAHVITASDRKGYVWRKYLRSPIDYRAAFGKINGRWKLVSFVRGD